MKKDLKTQNKQAEPPPVQPCPNCQGGQQHLKSATLMTWLGNDLITVPDFPSWICDMCGFRTYDSHALAQLSLLLSPEAGTPVQPSPHDLNKKTHANTPPPA